MACFSCRHCSMNFSSVETAVDHVHSHKLSEKPCVVPGCGQHIPKLTRHIKSSHPDLCKYPCDLCGRVFVKYRSLQQHKQSMQDCTIKKKRKRSRTKRKKKQVTFTSTTPSYFPRPFDELSYFASRFNELCFKEMEISNKSQSTDAYTGSVDFRSSVSETDLNRFISNKLQPTEEFNTEMKENVEKICGFLREHMRSNKIVKGGSLGKGTAVKGNSDIDLVLVLNEVKHAKDLAENMDGIKKKVSQMLKENFSQLCIIPYSISSDSRFLVKFTIRGTHDDIDVDLLPSFPFEDLRRLYSTLKTDKHHVEYYSAALAQQQIDFVSRYPANVKSLIRLVKHWKKQMVPSAAGERIPTSYVMELITIHLWEENKEGDGTFNTLKAFRGIMEALKNYKSLNAIWTKNYSRNEVSDEIRRQRPLVMDPANPTNNVCSGFTWEKIGNAAKQVLDSPMMRGVSSHSWK